MRELAGVSPTRLRVMRAAGRELVRCYEALARGQSNLLLDLLRGMGPFEQRRPYPPEHVVDRESFGAYYYHAHRAKEHGHFHTFLLEPGMPSRARPVQRPRATKAPPPEPYAHLVAIRVDPRGIPRGLFTVNRWVTNETWYAAPDVCAMLDRFVIAHATPSWLVNRWITAMVRLFHPQIVHLIKTRDDVLERARRREPDGALLESRRWEVLSEVAISIDDQITAVDSALDARR